jgi:hypothetical protein
VETACAFESRMRHEACQHALSRLFSQAGRVPFRDAQASRADASEYTLRYSEYTEQRHMRSELIHSDRLSVSDERMVEGCGVMLWR